MNASSNTVALTVKTFLDLGVSATIVIVFIFMAVKAARYFPRGLKDMTTIKGELADLVTQVVTLQDEMRKMSKTLDLLAVRIEKPVEGKWTIRK